MFDLIYSYYYENIFMYIYFKPVYRPSMFQTPYVELCLTGLNIPMFQTSNIEIVHYCQNMSGLQLPSVLLGSRYQKFRSNMPCHVYS